ncbi:zinc transporter ZIP1-like [Diaphorina citri]|uniref:Zinc transporter ZIP1-like n=1 Tax=Diaphorina citri TaxID=121845 RepID=A0A1S3CYR3_DIACI|nr:zinc transporter ZIP1-like [Diaphorina citri]
MASALLDLLPEVIETFSQIAPNSKFPLGEFVISFGFFVILIVEQIALFYKEEIPVNFSDDLVVAPRDDTRTMIPSSDPGDDPTARSPHSSFRSVLLFVSLSLHSLFEGLAIGIQPDLDTVLQVAVAVIIHKVIIGFSVGLKLIQSDLSVKSVAQLDFWFSLMSPLGIGIAVGIDQYMRNMQDLLVMTGIMQGLATGTFIYVTFFEVLPKEIQSGRSRLLKLLAILIGFITVCVVIYVDNQNKSKAAS